MAAVEEDEDEETALKAEGVELDGDFESVPADRDDDNGGGVVGASAVAAATGEGGRKRCSCGWACDWGAGDCSAS